MQKRFFILFLLCFVYLPILLHASEHIEVQNNRPVVTVIIDPAHGGKDPGGRGIFKINDEYTIFMEKDFTLKIAQALKVNLLALFPDMKIVLTRNDDIYIPLKERTFLANSEDLITDEIFIYVSIHMNASYNSNERGLEFCTDGSVNSIRFAEKVKIEFDKITGNELPFQGIKDDRWDSLRDFSMPAISAAIGFITNLEDALFLSTEQGINNSAVALANGIAAFIESL